MNPANARIPTTSWTLVKRLHHGGDEDSARAALATLCENYWYPLYAFARRSGSIREDAEDAVQSFLAGVVQKQLLLGADAAIGRFRTFLLTIFTRHLNDLRKLRTAVKRGGGAAHAALDLSTAEDSYAAEPVDHADPAAVFDRSWAHLNIGHAMSALRAEEHSLGRAAEFDALEKLIVPDGDDDGGCLAIAALLGISHDNVRKKLSRLRACFRRVLRDEIASTLASPDSASVDDELAALRAALRNG